LEEARKRKPQIDWATYIPPEPHLKELRVFEDYPLEELESYIDWSPFFHAWELKGVYPDILTHKNMEMKHKNCLTMVNGSCTR